MYNNYVNGSWNNIAFELGINSMVIEGLQISLTDNFRAKMCSFSEWLKIV